MRYYTLLIALLILNATAISQNKSDFEYTLFDSSVVGKDILEYTNKPSNIRDKKQQQKLENEKQQTVAKVSILKSQYAEYKEYPKTITDGWHSAIATDNINFCKEVKVYVKNNRVMRFVIDNYIPLDFKETREIKDAKNVISINNFNGEQMSLFELYFLYDIDNPTIVPQPIKACSVCFWTDIISYADIKLTFDGVRMEDFKVLFDKTPSCFSNGMICRILKPGTYSFKALGKGTINWKGSFELKENDCLKIRLGK